MKSRITLSAYAPFACAAMLLGAAGTANAAMTVENGVLSNTPIKGSVIYRLIPTSGSCSQDARSMVVDAADIKRDGTTYSPLDTGSSKKVIYQPNNATKTIKFEYNGATLTSTVKINTSTGATYTTSKEVALTGPLNYLEFEVKNYNLVAYVTISDVRIYKGTQEVAGPFSLGLGNNGTGGNIANKYATGEDLTTGFRVEATLTTVGQGNAFGGCDLAAVVMKVGSVAQVDDQAPKVSNVHNMPSPVLLNGDTLVEANVDDTNTGGSNIESADYKLDDGLFQVMFAADTVFDSMNEDVEALTDPLGRPGTHEVCVRGTDAANNTSGLVDGENHDPCVTFLVVYGFTGFLQPVDNGLLNISQAGRAVPLKWRLTDANGTPIDDPASFSKAFSYQVSCEDLSGEIEDSVEEYASGSSGLQYNGDGYWQFNLKTAKSYAGQCRAAYIEFQGGQISPLAHFKFK